MLESVTPCFTGVSGNVLLLYSSVRYNALKMDVVSTLLIEVGVIQLLIVTLAIDVSLFHGSYFRYSMILL